MSQLTPPWLSPLAQVLKPLRRKDLVRGVLFLLVVIGAAYRAGFLNRESLPDLSKNGPSSPQVFVLACGVLLTYLLLVWPWHLTVYDYLIVPIKDRIARRLRVVNYRDWMISLRPASCSHLNPEEIYGALKWESKSFTYPHTLGNAITPVLHTFYFLPAVWLPTLLWVPKADVFIVVAVVLIPGSFLADIAWEQKETTIFRRQEAIVKREIEKNCREHQ